MVCPLGVYSASALATVTSDVMMTAVVVVGEAALVLPVGIGAGLVALGPVGGKEGGEMSALHDIPAWQFLYTILATVDTIGALAPFRTGWRYSRLDGVPDIS